MAKQTINLGTTPNKGDGDPLRTAFRKINENFDELYSGAASELGAFEFEGSTITTTDSSDITIAQNVTITSDLIMSGDIVPAADNAYDLGSPTQQWRSLYLTGNTVYFDGIPLSVTDDGTLIIDGQVAATPGGATTWDSVTNKPAFANVATSGSYNDLTDTPTIPDVSNFITAADIPRDYQGSVFADDSTLLVDGVNASIPYSVLSGVPTIPADISDLTDTGNLLGAGSADSLTSNNDINIIINNDDSSSYIWNYGNTGILTLPNGQQIDAEDPTLLQIGSADAGVRLNSLNQSALLIAKKTFNREFFNDNGDYTITATAGTPHIVTVTFSPNLGLYFRQLLERLETKLNVGSTDFIWDYSNVQINLNPNDQAVVANITLVSQTNSDPLTYELTIDQDPTAVVGSLTDIIISYDYNNTIGLDVTEDRFGMATDNDDIDLRSGRDIDLIAADDITLTAGSTLEITLNQNDGQTDDSGIQLITNTLNATNTWTFGFNGSLTLPNDASITLGGDMDQNAINFSIPDSLNPSTRYEWSFDASLGSPYLQFPDNTLQATAFKTETVAQVGYQLMFDTDAYANSTGGAVAPYQTLVLLESNAQVRALFQVEAFATSTTARAYNHPTNFGEIILEVASVTGAPIDPNTSVWAIINGTPIPVGDIQSQIGDTSWVLLGEPLAAEIVLGTEFEFYASGFPSYSPTQTIILEWDDGTETEVVAGETNNPYGLAISLVTAEDQTALSYPMILTTADYEPREFSHVIDVDNDFKITTRANDFIINSNDGPLVIRNASGEYIFEGGTLTVPGTINIEGVGSVVGFATGEDNFIGLEGQANWGVALRATDSQLDSKNWLFGTNGVLTLPGEGVIRSNNDTVILQSYDTTFNVSKGIRIGTNGYVYFELGDDPAYFQIEEGEGDAQLVARTNLTIMANGGSTIKQWTFNTDGSITLPNDAVIRTDGSNVEVGGVTNFNVEASGVVNIYTDTEGTGYQWQFGDDGSIIFPDSTVQTTAYTGGGTADTGNVTFDDNTIQGNTLGTVGTQITVNSNYLGATSQNSNVFALSKTADTDQVQAGWIIRGSGGGPQTITNKIDSGSYWSFYVAGGIQTSYPITIESSDYQLGGGAQLILAVNPGDSSVKSWTFDSDGSITFPGGMTIETEYGGSPSLVIDGGGNYVDIRDSGTILIGYNSTGSVAIGNPEGGTLTEIISEKVIFLNQSVPATSIGVAGDSPGRVAFDATYIYYCTGLYNGASNIWKRVAWSGDTW